MFKTLVKMAQQWYVDNYCFQLVIPEFKGYHVAKTYSELLRWADAYEGYDVKMISLFPKRGEWAGCGYLFIGHNR